MKIFATLISILITLINANAQQEKIVIWHAFDGPLLTVFEKIIEDFNKSNQSIKVIPIKKGNYDDTLNTFLENPSEPDIVQIFEMGTAVMQEKNNFTSIDDVFSWISQPVPDFKLVHSHS
jgi:sn-glycerol 3-phosphate transport system substrate-binding protein